MSKSSIQRSDDVLKSYAKKVADLKVIELKPTNISICKHIYKLDCKKFCANGAKDSIKVSYKSTEHLVGDNLILYFISCF